MKKQHLLNIVSNLKPKPIRFLITLIVGLTLCLFLELNYFKFTKGIELGIQDGLMKWRNSDHISASEEIALIWVGEKTVKKYDGAPPPRDVEAKFFKALHQSGAKTIVWDFTFEMERKGTEDLVEATRQTDQLIYGVAFDEKYKRLNNLPPPLLRLTPFKLIEQNQAPKKDYVLERIPCQDLRQQIKHLGHIMLHVSLDGAARHIPLIVKINEQYYPALSLIAVCLFKDVPLDGSGVTVKWGEYILLDNNKGWKRKIPIDKAGRMRLNYIGGTDRFEQSYSFWNLERDLDTEIIPDSWRSLFSDNPKLVLIGDETNKSDWTSTPFSRNFPGVAVHATAIDNILRGEFVHETSPWLTIFLALCFSGVIVSSQLWLFRQAPQKQKSNYWLVIGFIIFSCFVLLYVGLTITSFHIWGRYLNLTLPLLGILLTWIFVTYYCYMEQLTQKTLELQEQEIQNKLLRERKEELEQLSAYISHKFGTSISTIGRWIGILTDEIGPDSPYAELIQPIRDEVEILTNKERNIKNGLSILAELREIELESGDLNQVVRESLKVIRKSKERSINGGRIQIKECLDDLPPLKLNTDWLKEAIDNLINNAIQAMPNGGALSIETESVKNHVILRVTDTGYGIPKENLPKKIFTPWFTTKKDGLGIGLRMVKDIVSLHGGEITCQSQMGKGTQFILRFPKGGKNDTNSTC